MHEARVRHLWDVYEHMNLSDIYIESAAGSNLICTVRHRFAFFNGVISASNIRGFSGRVASPSWVLVVVLVALVVVSWFSS